MNAIKRVGVKLLSNPRTFYSDHSVHLRGFSSSATVCAEGKTLRLKTNYNQLCLVPYTPRRSLMYVPGNDDRKLAKIPSLGADCICLDCEDGVAANMKEAARTNIRNILDTQRIEFGKVLLL